MKNVKDFFIKNKTLFIIVLLLVIVIGSSWAYFAAQVTGGASANINVTTDIPEEFILNVEKDLTLEVNVETLTEESDNITDTTKATATFKAGTNGDTSKTYNVYFNIEKNEYDYTTSEQKPEIILSITGPDGEITNDNIVSKDISYVTAYDKDSKEITGFDITNYQGLIRVAEDYIIEGTLGETTTQDWTFTLRFINLESNQKDNANKTLSSEILLQQDKFKSTIESNIETLLAEATKMDPTKEGKLIQHNGSIKGEDGTTVLDANDQGYRYSGNNPDNFICFGPGSKNYNERGESCPKENLYRIIGIVPVTKADGTEENLIKVIKSEYINETDLGLTANRSLSVDATSAKSPRIQTTTNIHGFHWNERSNTWTDGKYNYWSKLENTEKTPKVATLNEALNNPKTGYLSKLENSSDGIDWSDKIEEVEWNVGGVSKYDVTPKAMKEAEESPDAGGSITSKAQIGLMYIYDYGFASAKDNWTTNLNTYYTTGNQNGNWLFNGVYEWTISRYYSTSGYAFRVDYSGAVNYDYVDSYASGVRPVFYLKSNVEIKSDESAVGDSTHPFRIQ